MLWHPKSGSDISKKKISVGDQNVNLIVHWVVKQARLGSQLCRGEILFWNCWSSKNMCSNRTWRVRCVWGSILRGKTETLYFTLLRWASWDLLFREYVLKCFAAILNTMQYHENQFFHHICSIRSNRKGRSRHSVTDMIDLSECLYLQLTPHMPRLFAHFLSKPPFAKMCLALNQAILSEQLLLLALPALRIIELIFWLW